MSLASGNPVRSHDGRKPPTVDRMQVGVSALVSADEDTEFVRERERVGATSPSVRQQTRRNCRLQFPRSLRAIGARNRISSLVLCGRENRFRSGGGRSELTHASALLALWPRWWLSAGDDGVEVATSRDET